MASLPRPLSRLAAGGTLVLVVLAAGLGSLVVSADQGDSAREAIVTRGDGRFSGVVKPEDSTWFRFGYEGENQLVTITLRFEPEDANRSDMLIYTGSPDDPRREGREATRNGNRLTQTFSDPNGRDVFIRVLNDHRDRSVSFFGSITPTDALTTPPESSPTPTPGPVADTPDSALVIDEDGAAVGTVGPRRAVWYRFWYGNPGASARVRVSFAPSREGADLDLYTGSAPDRLDRQGGDPDRADDSLTRRVTLSTAQFVYFTVVNNNDGRALAYSVRVVPAFEPPITPTVTATPTATPTPTSTPAPTATPTPQPTSTPQPAPSVPRDQRYFGETGYRVDDDAIWGYFQSRGQLVAFGYPVSRMFTFLGCRAQIFQRQVAQVCAGQAATRMNILDPDIFPYTRVNGSTFPGSDPLLKLNTPQVGQPDYNVAILDFVRFNAPDSWEGEPVDFGRAFFSTVTPSMAGTSDPGILDMLNLEAWGAPISRPQRDPNNRDFIYQRFQRGILHYTASRRITQGVLLADYLKQILRDSPELPSDLRQQARFSAYFGQYCPGAPGWLCRPSELPGTDLTFAFERS
jgi:hypothetical protein